MAIKFREVEALWAVYKGQSVKEGAKLLNVSQPAVSMMLKNAEARFGIKLFDRIKGRIHPTPAAHHLFAYADRLFLSLGEFERQVLQLKDSRADSVSAAASLTLAIAILHPVLAAFQEEHGDAHIAIRTGSTGQVIAMAVQRVIDFGIVYGPVASTDLDVEDLGLTEIACLVRNDHRLARKKIVTPADLVGESIATYRSDARLGRAMEKVLRRAGAGVEILVQSTGFAAAQLAERGSSVALVDHLTLSGLFQGLTARRFEPRTSARVQLIFPKRTVPSPASRELIRHIKAFTARETLPGWRSRS